jgi:cytochrome P450
LFYLAESTHSQRKLRRLLDEAMPEGYSSWDYAAVRKISYLDDTINETLRLKLPVITGVQRETPPQGLQIGDLWIPGHVNVVVPILPIQCDPRGWQEPKEFILERWSERYIEMGTRDAPWLPFNQGVHHCAGKHVAILTLRTATSAIAQNFDISFARRFLSPVLMALRPLHLIFTAQYQEGRK